jgi:hypothetical protein
LIYNQLKEKTGYIEGRGKLRWRVKSNIEWACWQTHTHLANIRISSWKIKSNFFSLLEKILIFIVKILIFSMIFKFSNIYFTKKLYMQKIGKLGQRIVTHHENFRSNNANLRSPWKNLLRFLQGLHET